MEVDKGKLKTALPSVSLEVWQSVEKNVQETRHDPISTCIQVCKDPLTFLPGKSQCGCTAQTGRDSAGQGSGHKKEVIEFLVDLVKSSNGK